MAQLHAEPVLTLNKQRLLCPAPITAQSGKAGFVTSISTFNLSKLFRAQDPHLALPRDNLCLHLCTSWHRSCVEQGQRDGFCQPHSQLYFKSQVLPDSLLSA